MHSEIDEEEPQSSSHKPSSRDWTIHGEDVDRVYERYQSIKTDFLSSASQNTDYHFGRKWSRLSNGGM
jgi:hypothetical protein